MPFATFNWDSDTRSVVRVRSHSRYAILIFDFLLCKVLVYLSLFACTRTNAVDYGSFVYSLPVVHSVYIKITLELSLLISHLLVIVYRNTVYSNRTNARFRILPRKTVYLLGRIHL
jgi:hypothetical protein